jgi:SAM-dependent methyltransferase
VFGAALPEISPDGLELTVRFEEVELMREHLQRFEADRQWIEVEVDLRDLVGRRGRLSVECSNGPDGNPCGDWLALYELVVAREEEMPVERARAFRSWREKNRVEVKPVPYVTENSNGLLGWFRPKRSLSLSPPGPHRYAADLLQKELGKPMPNFADRLQDRIEHLKKGAKLRVLSLCSGSGDKERRLLERAGNAQRVSLTLVERSEALLKAAEESLREVCEVRGVQMDPDQLDLQGERFDVVLCAGGLHRVLELERLGEQVWRSMVQEGELWAIGQYVGRSGARLWPEAYAIANPFFRQLPERYRVNHSMPGRRVDADLPNLDFSIGTFDAVRSEEIEAVLSRWFLPHQLTKQACFVWRLLDPAYRANYDLERKEDRAVIERAAVLDAEHQRQGGKPAELNAVYRRRM